MFPKKGLSLRKIGKQYLIVDTEHARVNFSRVFTLNETAAWLWEKIGDRPFTPEQLTEWLCQSYEVETETARRDVEQLLDEWKKGGLLSPEEEEPLQGK